MATWIAHLRVAEQLAICWPIVDSIAYYVGNLGPDSGVMNQTTKEFDPPSEVSHWQRGPYKDSIDPEAFYQTFLTKDWNDFYLGYYIHLWCDIIWDRRIGIPMRERFRDELAHPDFIWEIKRDWYAHDNHFLRDHPSWQPLESLCGLDAFPNRYLDYYPEDALIRQIQYICHYYHSYDFPVRTLDYLSRSEYEDYIAAAVAEIDDILRAKKTA